ncbi:MAG: class I SAM-dependent methyltransferase [Aerococcus suis]|nr:class I SAM-dependent methyltransferase [Aerococcus suis]
MGIYETFCEVYDSLFDDSLYPQWLSFTEKVVPELTSKTDWLDLGCGDGKLAVLAKQSNYSITGVDLSPTMIERAQSRAQEAKVNIPFKVADMLTFYFEDYHPQLITCFCDSLLYLNEYSKQEQVMRNVYHHLKANGVFIFDIIHPNWINYQYPGYTFVHEWDDVVFTWTSDQFRGENTIDHSLNMFLEDEDGRYERYEELHEQFVAPIEDYVSSLTAIGFTEVTVTADFSTDGPNDTSKRIFFTCRKG